MDFTKSPEWQQFSLDGLFAYSLPSPHIVFLLNVKRNEYIKLIKLSSTTPGGTTRVEFSFFSNYPESSIGRPIQRDEIKLLVHYLKEFTKCNEDEILFNDIDVKYHPET